MYAGKAIGWSRVCYRMYKRQSIKLESLHIGELTVGWPLAFKERKAETSRDKIIIRNTNSFE